MERKRTIRQSGPPHTAIPDCQKLLYLAAMKLTRPVKPVKCPCHALTSPAVIRLHLNSRSTFLVLLQRSNTWVYDGASGLAIGLCPGIEGEAIQHVPSELGERTYRQIGRASCRERV